MIPLLAAEPGFLNDPVSLLIAAVVAESSAIGFLVAWIRTLYGERRQDQENELKYRDEMLERVLVACGKLADAIAVVTARSAP